MPVFSWPVTALREKKTQKQKKKTHCNYGVRYWPSPSLCCQRGCETPSDVEAVVAGRRQQAPEMVRRSRTFPLTVPGRRVWGLLYEPLHLGNGRRRALSHRDGSAAGRAGSLSDFKVGGGLGGGGVGGFLLIKCRRRLGRVGHRVISSCTLAFQWFPVSQKSTVLLFDGHLF